MSAFEASVNVLGTSIAVPEEESIKAGAPSVVEVILAVAMQLPFAQQQGAPPMMAHIGNIKYQLDRDSAIKFFRSGLEAAEKSPAASNLAIATDLSAVENAAEQMNRFRDGD